MSSIPRQRRAHRQSESTDHDHQTSRTRLSISYVAPADLKLADRKLRSHDKRQMGLLRNSLRQFGFVAPILVNAESVILDGHALVEAARSIGVAELPVVRVDHLDGAQERALRIALNKLPELATWDREALGLEFAELFELSLDAKFTFDLDLTGFCSPERDVLIEATRVANDDEADAASDADAEGPPVSRPGDCWVLGEHRIICGNARDPETYEALFGEQRAAMAFNDPPYDLNARFISSRHGGFVEGSGELGANFTAFLTEHLKASVPFMTPGAVIFECMDWRHMKEMVAAGEATGLELANLVVWDKGQGYMGGLYRSQHELVFAFRVPSGAPINNVQLGRHGRNRTNVWAYPGAAAMRKLVELHPTPKNVTMVADAILDVSHRGDLVLDCFSGSGTTVIAAAKTDRRARAIDLDPRYVDVGVRRWERWSGMTARHVETGLTFAETTAQRAKSEKDAAEATGTPARVRDRVRPAA